MVVNYSLKVFGKHLLSFGKPTLYSTYSCLEAKHLTNLIIHLEILHLGFPSLEQSLKLEVGGHLVEDEDLAVDVLPGRVEKVVQKVTDGDISNVPTQDDELLLFVNLPNKVKNFFSQQFITNTIVNIFPFVGEVVKQMRISFQQQGGGWKPVNSCNQKVLSANNYLNIVPLMQVEFYLPYKPHCTWVGSP